MVNHQGNEHESRPHFKLIFFPFKKIFFKMYFILKFGITTKCPTFSTFWGEEGSEAL